ncbi:hypothetical protein PENARI_c017G09560 [Penicillium arizonense]|uniref:Hydrophobin n=1 Tax=Penicillium arizonense TaxID=1835702 RepID=A0A1F5LBI0_PENAI|nr:hypothetical protein PENARI_c017G09560 [Penicillium arizonense]OGE50289.1 hypothetical protein PENARI_c017G09560 [Penicillium arizonense]
MQMTSFTAILALAMSVAAVAPVAQKTNMGLTNSAAMGHAKGQCSSGDIACCDSKEVLSGDGILGNLLAKGALNGLLGNDDAACAKTSALDDLNVLASTKDTESGPVCKNIIACCPEGSGKCTAIDAAE